MLSRLGLSRSVVGLLAAQIASQMGDAAFAVLLLWATLHLSSSKVVLGAVAALSYLPVLLFGLVGGLAADRLPRRGVMIASDATRAGVCLSLPLLAAAGVLSPWALAAGGFALFAASAFFNPARDAAVPSLVPVEALLAANAVLQASVPLGWLLGPAFCSLLLRWADPVTLFAGVGALFVVSVGFLTTLPRLPAVRQGSMVSGEVFGGLRIVGRDVRLRWLVIITAVDNLLIMGPAVVGTPILVREVLRGGASDYALIEAMYAVGALVGLPLAARLNRAFGQGKVLIAGIFLDGISYLPLFWVDTVTGVAVTIAVHSLAIPMITVTRTTLIQRITPLPDLGKVFALISMAVVGLTAISAGVTGVLASQVPVRLIFGAVAVLASLCGPVALLSREFREA